VKGADGLYNYLQAVQGYLAPPIFVVFFFGVFWKRLNAQGCLWAMIVGFVLGVFRMLVDTPVTLGLFGTDPPAPPRATPRIDPLDHQQHQLPILQHPHHIVSAIVMVAVSYVTPEPDYQKTRGLTYGTATPEDRAKTHASWIGLTWQPPSSSWSASLEPTSTSAVKPPIAL